MPDYSTESAAILSPKSGSALRQKTAKTVREYFM